MSVFFLDNLSEIEKRQISVFNRENKFYSYEKLAFLVNECAKYFYWEKNIKSGETIISILENSFENVIIFLAAMKLGLKFHPINCDTNFYSILKVSKQLKVNNVVFSEFLNKDLQKRIKELNMRKIFVKKNFIKTILSKKRKKIKYGRYGKLLINSSGTTGNSKIIQIDFFSLIKSAKNFIDNYKIKRNNCFWNFLPMSYLGGLFNLLIIPLVARGKILIDESFSGNTFLIFWSTIENHKISVLWLVPTILNGLLKLYENIEINEKKYENLINHTFIGTAPITYKKKIQFFKKFNLYPLENYGLSETTFISLEKKKNIGRLFIDQKVRVKIKYSNKENKIGNILVKSPFLCDGYLSNGKLIKIKKNIFWDTGDIGFKKLKRLVITGRKRDIIKKGGILIGLNEIEEAIINIESVENAVCKKIDDKFYVENYNLFIELSDTKKNKLKLIKIKDKILNIISKSKWPNRIFIVKKIPKTTSGKNKKNSIEKHILYEIK